MAEKIQSLTQYLTLLEQIEKQKKHGHEIFYRGHEDVKYNLQPSLFRSNRLIANEYKLYREAIIQNPNEFVNDTTTLEKLVRMQHFGLPTRILDLTKNPVVALFFACSNQNGSVNKKVDGEIVMLQSSMKEVKYYDSDSVSILSNLCKLKTNEKKFNTDLPKDEFNKSGNIYKLLHAIREEKSYFTNVVEPKDLNRILFVKVKKNNPRVLVQDGLFLIFGIGKDKQQLSVPQEWVLTDSQSNKIIIDKDSKYKILRDLERINISNKALFPEMESSSKYLKKSYS